ncbi:Phage integrase protein [Marine Group I thaumarchaeote SCGC AAA799-E16]|uniref:Phage integrase protein n=5 Tax=Marine Group I TaxID=905826 RepID=A0A087S7F2_9ARCH|nr:Phage integrase protein [Marine Group I thaumarchaeote SCGC AAA799-N04]KER05996.1 Phage integrase protein [Marine Group I thaumarchaeote SCGC AAA799-E16]KFM18021.1 Phage integrase protein [Marine Group I thaumarchaeote SCGC RSA3]KFM18138.1 Phage integrase protein [Marine Group I thaumarchaeote SCGC AAA799-P11]KFM21656.1 Phage integrase protein [Marine Group I thaumarchaeote SCGC AAA799-B03]
MNQTQRQVESFEEFCNLESMQELLLNLRGSKHKNSKPKSRLGLYSTQMVYANRLYNLHKWLSGRKFEFNNFVHTGENTFKNQRETVTIQGLEHVLRLYQNSFNSRRDFVLLLKKYLHDPTHNGKFASSMVVERSAIQAYFKWNESEIAISFDPKKRYKVKDSEDEEPSLSLEELMKMLTVGRPTLVQKAVILCKFQRGLDTATLVDRFNFEAWRQLVEYFGTEMYLKWDLSMCPVPIKLTRMKTDFSHTGFLDIDAVKAIQEYLKDEEEKKGRKMSTRKPLFVNQKNNLIDNHWVSRSFNRMAETAGIQTKLEGYSYKTKYSKDSHELRDLLESTLLDSGVRADVVEHVTGHKPKDSYEKQSKLFPASLRSEYVKASKRLNIFSNLSQNMKGDDEKESLRHQNELLQRELENERYNSHKEIQTMKENQEAIMAWIQRQSFAKKIT